MTISRVELRGQITRAQDFTTIKQNEDNKGLVNQGNIQKQFKQTIEQKLHQVHEGDDANNEEKRYDAKEKGNGTYSGNGGRQKKKNDKEKDGKVIAKVNHGFDIKI